MIRRDETGQVDEITGTDAHFEMLHDGAASLHIGTSHVYVTAVGGKLVVNVMEEGRPGA